MAVVHLVDDELDLAKHAAVHRCDASTQAGRRDFVRAWHVARVEELVGAELLQRVVRHARRGWLRRASGGYVPLRRARGKGKRREGEEK